MNADELRGSTIVAMVLLGAATGALTGLAAFILVWSVTKLNIFVLDLWRENHIIIALTAACGGFISGVIAKYVSSEVEGHGTDAAIRAVVERSGFIPFRVPLAKLAATIATVGLGGSGGLVGPMAHVGAGISSFFSSIARVKPRIMRALALSGIGSGVSAVLKAPLCGALAGLEILYRGPGLERGALIPSLVASFTSYLVIASFMGFTPILYRTISMSFAQSCSPTVLGLALLLGFLCGLLSRAYSTAFYGMRSLVDRVGIPRYLAPALGSFAAGLVAYVYPQVSGAGYIFFPRIVMGLYPTAMLLALSVSKLVTNCLTVGSRGSGGVVAPAIFIGASFGAFVYKALHLASIIGIPPSMGAMMGVVGILSGVCRIPLAAIALAVEATGCPALIAPSILVAVTSYLVAGPRATIYRSQREGSS